MTEGMAVNEGVNNTHHDMGKERKQDPFKETTLIFDNITSL